MEAFYTLQGEGYHQGKAAYFIRLAGCDVGCHWCDVKESWNVDPKQYNSIENIVNGAKENPSRFTVITGGEPLIYDLNELTNELVNNDFTIAIETSGAYPLSGEWHWICLSPKKFKAPLESIYPKAKELKVIIYNKSDFSWAEEHAKKVSKDCLLYLQVEWSKKEEMTPLVIDYIKKNPKWRISNQSHKYLNIP
jgi:organic radical activating enzyme